MRSINPSKEDLTFEPEEMHDKMLMLGERFLQEKLTPIYYVDEKTNTTFILRFEKALHGLH